MIKAEKLAKNIVAAKKILEQVESIKEYATYEYALNIFQFEFCLWDMDYDEKYLPSICIIWYLYILDDNTSQIPSWSKHEQTLKEAEWVVDQLFKDKDLNHIVKSKVINWININHIELINKAKYQDCHVAANLRKLSVGVHIFWIVKNACEGKVIKEINATFVNKLEDVMSIINDKLSMYKELKENDYASLQIDLNYDFNFVHFVTQYKGLDEQTLFYKHAAHAQAVTLRYKDYEEHGKEEILASIFIDKDLYKYMSEASVETKRQLMILLK